ncbi:peptide/nickel transport system ATP-binding protein [Tissierella praeacuta DSM 18095]|uniref:Nickel import system ATP-binding protein NikD n=1 Tax=Tissierella praeacuta DSM 18095 TaxID=1123404 RepID=A0A1M4YHQ7_9FIRM|nr:ABC transporter ATP-binding protein [Tissierella praeacuta]TCU66417.1 peptide/nickel transport system ATP-binding protein [Tissierella praeacuta]SHF05188.1 peptide/nickel transport system ATP-binding protein [Tissierella praeacuta DSM 18095]SUP02015.1 Glutathione import ATP-binding protein GsiA [Tissierella praeacuta]
MNKRTPLLEVKDFTVNFRQYVNGLHQRDLQVIHNFTLDLYPGEIMAIVGASGSGKSLLAHSIMGILPTNAYTTGSIKFKGKELTEQLKEEIRGKEISLIPQSVAYLDPLMKTGKQIDSPVKKIKNSIKDILKRFELSSSIEGMFPFQLSGGMARRVLISTALTSGADLIIADEPTPGLHKSVVNETLNTLRGLADNGCGVLMITHDIDLAFIIADRIAVFNKGVSVEIVDAKAFEASADNVKHPYSKALWHALPQNGFNSIRGKDYGDLIDMDEILPGGEV